MNALQVVAMLNMVADIILKIKEAKDKGEKITPDELLNYIANLEEKVKENNKKLGIE